MSYSGISSWLLAGFRQNFTLATMDNCKKFAVIVSITTICSYINFSHSIWQRPAPKQLWARLTRTLSNSGVRQNRQVLPGWAECSERKGETPWVSSQRELKFKKAFLKSYHCREPKWNFVNIYKHFTFRMQELSKLSHQVIKAYFTI